jgi:hypothetical protein
MTRSNFDPVAVLKLLKLDPERTTYMPDEQEIRRLLEEACHALFSKEDR